MNILFARRTHEYVQDEQCAGSVSRKTISRYYQEGPQLHCSIQPLPLPPRLQLLLAVEQQRVERSKPDSTKHWHQKVAAVAVAVVVVVGVESRLVELLIEVELVVPK